MEVHSHGINNTLGMNKEADKVFTPELKDILAPPSSQIPAGENFTIPPAAHPADVHEKDDNTSNSIGADSNAAPAATFSFPPATSDLNNAPSDINFQQYESVGVEEDAQHEIGHVGEQDMVFDDMVILEGGTVTSASLSGGGPGDAIDSFQDTDIQMDDFQQAPMSDIYIPPPVASDVSVEANVDEKSELPPSVVEVQVSATVVSEVTCVSEAVQELPAAPVMEQSDLATVEASHDLPSSHEKEFAPVDHSGVQSVDVGKSGEVDVEQLPTSDVAEEKVPEVMGAAEEGTLTALDGDTLQKNESGQGGQSHEVTEEDIQAMKGQKVVKKFGRKNFGGEVVEYDPDTKWFKVVYEDGDDEDLELWEVKLILASSRSSSSKKRPRSDGGGEESSQKSSKKPKKSGAESTAKKAKTGSTSSAKSPKTPGSKAKASKGAKKLSTSRKAKSPRKSTKKALDVSAYKTPGDSEVKEGKGRGKTGTTTPKSNKGGSSKKRTTGKVARSLNLQSPKPQKRGKSKVSAESSSKKAVKSPRQPTSGVKRKAEGGEISGEKATTRSKRGVTQAEEASKGDPSSIVGKHVKKNFGGTIYDGVVVKFDNKTQFYKVKYEDGDQEDLELHEVEPILAQEAEEKEDKPAKLSSLSYLMSAEKKVGLQKRK